MGRTLVSVCVVFLLFVGCLGQETTESQTSTDAPANVDWDKTDLSLPIANADAQSQSGVPSSTTYQDYETFLSNPWGPMLMQMNMSPYGDRLYNRRSRYETQGNLDVNPFLRRPDVNYPRDWNDTTPQAYDSYPINSNYQPYPPQGLFYPQQDLDQNSKNIDYPDQSDTASDQEDTQPQDDSKLPTDTVISQPPPFYRPPFSRPYANRDQQFYYPPMNYFWQNQDNIRRQGNTLPSAPYPYPPGFYPPGGPPTYPQVNVFVQPPTSEDKPGSATQENAAERRQSVPEPLSPTTPPPNNLPVGAPYPLRPSFPYPPNPYLFGYPPAPFQPPFPPALLPRPTPTLPNIPPPPPNNLIDIPVQGLLHPPRREDLPPLPPPKTVPDVVNVDVIGPEADAKPAEGNIPYKFGYDSNDGLGTDQHREESADGSGVVTGSYSYRDPNGVYRVVNYIADKDGFRASVKTNEPGAANPGSADVVVFAERPPLKTVVESLRRSDVEVAVASDQSEMEIEDK